MSLEYASPAVTPVRSGKSVVEFRWSISYKLNGVKGRKQGRLNVSHFAQREGLDGRTAVNGAREQARQNAESALEDLKKEAGERSRPVTVQEWFDYCDETVWCRLGNKGRYTSRRRASADRYFLPRFGGLPLSSLTPEAMVEWFDWLRDTEFRRGHRNRRGEVIRLVPYRLNHKSRLNVRDEVGGYLTQAVRYMRLPTNPMAAAQPSRRDADAYRRSLTKARQFLTLDQLRAFLRAAREDQCWPVTLIQRDLGTRVSEACGLRIEDCDPGTRIAHVRVQLHRETGSGLVEGDPKTSAGVRPGVMSEELADLVRRRAEAERGRALLGEAPCPYVAVGANMKPFDGNLVAKRYGAIARLAGFELSKGHKTHVIRRTVLDAMAKTPGLSDETLALIAGHEDAEVTKTIYGNLPERQQEELRSASAFWLARIDA